MVVGTRVPRQKAMPIPGLSQVFEGNSDVIKRFLTTNDVEST